MVGVLDGHGGLSLLDSHTNNCYSISVEKISEFLREFGVIVVVGLIGGGILIYGLWGEMGGEQATVEIVKKEPQTGEIVVDVAGAVEKPGVYTLPSGSRIGEALVVAGGLSAQADREWVARTVNLAAELEDSAKIYIPSTNSNGNPKSEVLNSRQIQNSKLININTASVGELDTLAGIGEVRAQAIVAGRPYSATEEIVSKAKIPESVYEEIKDSLTLY